MNKKIKVEEISLNVISGTIIYINIDVFRFLYEKGETDLVKVYMLEGEEFEHFENIFLEETIEGYKDLKRVAFNWIFDNVEIVTREKLIESVKED